MFQDKGNCCIGQQFKVLQHFPRFFGQEENLSLGREITLDEVERILKLSAKEKSPGPDGWPVEFYLGFSDVVGKDLLEVVKQSKRDGLISGNLVSFLSDRY